MDALISWLQTAIANLFDASKREMTMLWNVHLGVVDTHVASPETTPALFKEIVETSQDFTVGVEDVHKRFFEGLEVILGELEERLQTNIDALGTRGKPTANANVRRLRAVNKMHIANMYRHTTARVVSQLKVTAANDFASAVHEIRQYRTDPREVLFMLEKEKLDTEVHPTVEPFVVDGFCVGPATRNGRPLVMRHVCRYCTTVFHGKSVRDVAAKRPYLEKLLLRQCPNKPEVICADSLELARVTHTGPSDEFVVALRDAHKNHYKSERSEANKRYYANRRDMLKQ